MIEVGKECRALMWGGGHCRMARRALRLRSLTISMSLDPGADRLRMVVFCFIASANAWIPSGVSWSTVDGRNTNDEWEWKLLEV